MAQTFDYHMDSFLESSSSSDQNHLEIPIGLKNDLDRLKKNFPERKASENNIDLLPMLV